VASVIPSQAQRPLALAIDVGSSSSRALLYDRLGRAVSFVESRTPYKMKITSDGGAEMNPDELLAIVCRNIDDVLERAESLAGEICGVGFCTFWHSLVGVSREGRAVTPIYNWNDTRSREDAEILAGDLGADWIHSRTGAAAHASYYPAKLLWLRRADPHGFSKVARWMSFGEYFQLKTFGRALASVSMASGTGLMNVETCDWDGEMLKYLRIGPDHLSPIASDDEMFTGLIGEYARRWPALAGVPWTTAAGDGATSNIGAGCVTRDRVALMVGTSGAMRVCWRGKPARVPRGLWCYRATREYAVMGGALSNGGDVFDWCRNALKLGAEDSIEARLAAMEADSHGLTVLPFFSGERSTGWADYARAAVAGMSLDTEPIEVLRAMLESVAYRFAAIYDLLGEATSPASRVIASGGGLLGSPAWTQIMADVMGVAVIASAVPEASSRGAAILLFNALDHISDLDEVAAPLGAVYEPDADNHERYARARARQQSLYDRLIVPGE
jgi:gluconokinase